MYGYNLGLAKARVSESVPAAPANVVQPLLVGNGAVGSVVTCNPGAWSGSPSPTFVYDFRIDGSSVQSGASNTYTPLIGDDTKTLTCLVTATNTEGSASEGTSNSLVVGTIPNNTVAPVISGTNTFGSTLTTTDGTFTGTAPLTYTYQWRRNGSPISGQTASTYVIGSSDSLAAITCVVTATNSYGFDSEVSDTITVVDFAPVNQVAPTVSPSGTQSTGTLITADVESWDGVAPITFEYKWTRDGIAISGQTASTYTIQLADDGTTIRVEVKGTNAYGTSAFVASSNSVSAVNTVAPSNTVAPVISGTAVVGQTLTTTDGTWDGIPTPTFSYQWKRGATNVGTNASTYTLVSADAGQSITCVVTATNAGGSANATSNALSVLATLLDIYPSASAAYSVRLLSGARYNNALLRIRRSNDNAEVDVFVDSNYQLSLSSNITSRTSGTTLSTWVGSNNGFIVTWYDQSGNSNNATQSNPANQPQIVISGAIVSQNSKTAIQNNSLFNARLINNSLSVGTTQSIFAVGNSPQSDRQVFFDSFNTVPNAFLRLTDPNVMSFQGSTSLITTNSNQKLFSLLTSTDLNVWENNSLTITNVVNTTSGFSGISLFDIRGNPTPLVPAYGWEGKMQEIVIYSTIQSSNRTGIQNNINSFYGIY
jgi:hypothetical protein